MDNERQGYIGNLKRKSKIELEELLQRQQKLLENRTPKQSLKMENILKRHDFAQEESAVCYPLGPHQEVKNLTLNESLHLQKKHLENLQELELKHAAAHLATQTNFKMGEYIPDPTTVLTHREISSSDSSDSEDPLDLD